MNFIRTSIEGVVIIEPDVYRDERGFFLESYNLDRYRDGGVCADFVQDNHSFSGKGVLRGLHIQVINPQAKLVRVVRGRVFDVAVDARVGSPTFGEYVSCELSDENMRQFFIPRGFLHGFCVLSEHADFEYKCDNYYCKQGELTVAWDDEDIAIDWPLTDPVISEKDKAGSKLADVKDRLLKYQI